MLSKYSGSGKNLLKLSSNEINKADNEPDHKIEINYVDFDKRINEVDEKCEEDDIREKNNNDKIKDQDEIAFFERLKYRLENKDKFRPDKSEASESVASQLQSVQGSQKGSVKNSVKFSNKDSLILIPSLYNPNHPNNNNPSNPINPHTNGLISRRNSVIIQNEMFSRQNSLLPKLSKALSGRLLPDSVRQPTLVHNLEIMKRKTSEGWLERIAAKKHEQKLKEEKEKEIRSNLKVIERVLDSTTMIVIMCFAIAFALLADDIKTLSFPNSVDYGFDITKTICFTIFLLEILFSSVAKKDYIISFFFWLDLISTLSLILDIDFMIYPLIYGSSTADIQQASSVISIARATSTLRVLRIIRLVRVVKLYKNMVQAKTLLQEAKSRKEKELLEKQLALKKKAEEKEKELKALKNGSKGNSPTKIIRRKSQSSKMFKPFEHKKTSYDIEAQVQTFLKLRSINTNMALPKIQVKELITLNPMIDSEREKLETARTTPNDTPRDSTGLVNNTLTDHQLNENEFIDEQIESNISKIVSESIIKIIICLIISMILFFPLLDWSLYDSPLLDNYNILANTLEKLQKQYEVVPLGLNNTMKSYIENYYDPAYPLLNITSNNNTLVYYLNNTINNITYRIDEVGAITSEKALFTVYYLVIEKNRVLSIISLVKTLFICIVLIMSAFMFEGDANELVLRPLDVMTDIINNVVNDPIGARNIDTMNLIKDLEKQKDLYEIEIKENENITSEENFITIEDRSKKKEKAKEKEKEIVQKKELLEEHAEIQVIQKSIIKISALLAIGFGEAGSDIIKHNLKSNVDLDPMIKGQKKTVFMGFCDIRDFSKVNLALKEETFIFVNKIAEIVHKSVDKFGGATNKNIGDAFLSVWKFPELTPNGQKYEISPTNIYSRIVADKAVLSFLYIIRAIKVSQQILEYSENKHIKEMFGDEGYKVNMGFGLHYGWAIEGTIGSKFKIDASYLSPNVNISARLEAATRQYGVSILISGTVFEFLSLELKNMCREIDRVTVKGSIKEICLYTIDVNLKRPSKKKIKKKKKNLTEGEKIKKYLEKKMLYKSYFDKVETIIALNFRTDFFLKNLAIIFENRMSEKFYSKFTSGFDNYISGKWQEAKNKFSKCLQFYPNDGPTNTLYDFIEKHDFVAPSNWKGYRELTSK